MYECMITSLSIKIQKNSKNLKKNVYTMYICIKIAKKGGIGY